MHLKYLKMLSFVFSDIFNQKIYFLLFIDY